MTVEAMFEHIRMLSAQVRDAQVRALLFAFLDDGELVPAFLRAPAAKSIHHAYPGGLCEHTLSVMQLGWRTCDHYPQLDRDLVTAGCLLHDIGKAREISPEPGFEYTDEGKLVGHLVLTCQLIREKASRIPGFPRDLEWRITHLVASHHGRHEYGSPKEPAAFEAVVVHALERGGLLGAAVLVPPVVGRDQVRDPPFEVPRESRDPRGLLANQLAGEHQVSDQLPLVRVLEARLGGDLARLADVVEQAPGGDQVAIELGVMVADAPAELHDGERVLAEAARVGVMDALGRRRPQEGRGQLAVVEEREEKRPHVGVAHLGREYADVLEHRLYGHAVDVSHGPDARRSVGRPDAGDYPGSSHPTRLPA